MEHSYVFKVTAYNTENLLPQVSRALEKRTQTLSREKYPGLWKRTDRLNSMTRGRSKTRIKVTGIICLLLGIFLLVPGIMKPKELLGPLIVGAGAVIYGAAGLFHARKRKNPYDNSARILLKGKDAVTPEDDITVTFTPEGMTIPAEGGAAETVPYTGFETAVETEDTLLFIYGERVTLLQKKDLAEGDMAGLTALLSENIKRYLRAE